jgi:hypothetical protein
MILSLITLSSVSTATVCGFRRSSSCCRYAYSLLQHALHDTRGTIRQYLAYRLLNTVLAINCDVIIQGDSKPSTICKEIFVEVIGAENVSNFLQVRHR